MKRLIKNYRFDINDIRAIITVLNVVCIMFFGLTVSWLGLAVAVFGLIKDITTDKRLSGALMHFSNIILNIYFLSILYH